MRMMFAVGRLNRSRSKIVVAGRLREIEIPAPLTPSRRSPAGPDEVVQHGAGRPAVDRIRGGGRTLGEGSDTSRHLEGRGRIH